jgi:nucleoside-diphosphate-sugar epimerase
MAGKIVVSGAAGFIGSHVATALARAGYQVLATDIVAPPSQILKMLNKAGVFEFKQGDLTDACFVDNLLNNIDGMVHGAGVSRVSTTIENPVAACQSSSLATTQLLSSIGKSSISWFMLLSSREVERIEQGCQIQSQNDLYAVMKQNTELLAQCFCMDANIPLQICRLSDVYGSLLDHKKKLLSIFIDKAIHGVTLSVFDSTNLFYFTHITDVIEGILDGIKELDAAKEFLKIRQFWEGEGLTAEDLAYIIRDLVDGAVDIIISEPDMDENNSNIFQSHITNKDDFVAKIDFKSGIESLLNEYRNNLKVNAG